VALTHHVVAEERDVLFAFVEVVRGQNTREDGDPGVELHPHQAGDDRVGNELVTIDAYARDVLRRVSFVRAAQQVGLPLIEIRERLDTLPLERAPTKEEWERLAESWRPRLDEQIALLEGIRDRLALCIGCGCQTLDSCDIFNPDDVAAKRGPGAQYLFATSEPIRPEGASP